MTLRLVPDLTQSADGQSDDAAGGHDGALHYYFDAEFLDDGHTIELISIGMVCEDGREYYAEAPCDLSKANEFVQAHVIPHLEGRITDRATIAAELIAFVSAGGRPPQFWAYFCSYDWVVLCQLFGPMMALPEGWPQFCHDLKQEAHRLDDPPLPPQAGVSHHALADARWNRITHRYLTGLDEILTAHALRQALEIGRST